MRDAHDLSRVLADERSWSTIILGPGLVSPVEAARGLRLRHPDALLILVVEPARLAAVQHHVLVAPAQGEPLRCVALDAHAPRAIEQHLRQAALRRRHARTLEHANAALAAGAQGPRRAPPAMEQLLEATPVPMLLMERGGRLLHRNAGARALHPERATSIEQALAGIDPAALARVLGATDAAVTLRRVSLGGRSYDIIGGPLAGTPTLDAALVILDDVTELVRSEEERRQAADLHATLLAVQSDMGQGVLIARDERIMYVNEALARMVGCTAAQLVSHDPFDLVATAERDRVRGIHQRRRNRDREVPDVYESTLRAVDGREFPAELSARVLPDGRSTLLIVRDITQRRQMQAQVDQARASLAQMDKLATVGSLVGGLAHEIRTPLAAIMNEAHLIERQVRRALEAADPKVELAGVGEHVAALEGAIERIRRLIRDMRSFMRGEAPEKSRFAVDTTVADAVRFFEGTQRGNVRVETKLASTRLVDADPAQLQQIVLNLLQNAADASPSGAVVTVETRDEPDAVVVAVVDNGSGIPPEVQARMFEPFVTTKPRGSGLGLAIVRRLVELHDARIRIESAVGVGSRFEVVLPARA